MTYQLEPIHSRPGLFKDVVDLHISASKSEQQLDSFKLSGTTSYKEACDIMGTQVMPWREENIKGGEAQYSSPFSAVIDKALDPKTGVHSYPERSLICLPYDKPTKEQSFMMISWHFRHACIRVLEHRYFDPVVLVLITINCLTMAIVNPLDPKDSTLNLFLEVVAEPIFIVLFTLEMSVKIVSWGFLFGKNAYLRSQVNWVDFVCVVAGWLPYLHHSMDFAAIRAVRALRPLRSLTKIAEMRRLVTCLLDSTTQFASVFAVLLFFFVVFGILGVQLFKGSLHYVCHAHICPQPLPTLDVLKDLTTDDPCWAETGDICNPSATAGDLSTGWACEEEEVCLFVAHNPNEDITHFDDFPYAFVTLFQAISLEGWVDVMYTLQDGVSIWVWPYFYLMIFFGSFFVVNLFLAVLCEAFDGEEEEVGEERSSEKEEQAEIIQSTSLNSNNTPGTDSEDDPQAPPVPRISQRSTRDVLEDAINSQRTQSAVVTLIVLNVILMACEHYPMEPYDGFDDFMYTLVVANWIFTFIFTAESALKIMVLGPRKFSEDRMNLFDFVVVVFSIAEVVMQWLPGEVSIGMNFSVLRSFRLLRVFKPLSVALNWPGLMKVIHMMMESIVSVSYLSLILLLVMFIFALLGMEIFGATFEKVDSPYYDREYDNRWEGDKPRAHMDGVLWAMLSIFIVLSGENWNELMYEYKAANGPVACVYFIALFTVGNYVVVNLFIAILLSGFAPSAEEQEGILDQRAELMKTRMVWNGKNASYDLATDEGTQGKVGQSLNGDDSNGMGAKKKTMTQMAMASHPDKSLFLFSWQGRIRLNCALLTQHPNFDWVIVFLIIISSLCLALDAPLEPADGVLRGSVLPVLDYTFTTLFTIELVLKVITMGFILPRPSSYMSNGWNKLDFCVVLVSIGSLFGSETGPLAALRSLRTLRALRPLRLVSRAPGMKQVVNALFSAVPAVKDVLAVAFLFWSIFAILGTQLFSGKFAQCNDPEVVIKEECNGSFLDLETGEKADRDWSNPPFGHFDDFLHSMLLLIEVMGLEGWPDVMFLGMDVGQNQGEAPTRDASPAAAIFFVAWVVIGSFFVLNMVVGCVIDNFDQLRQIESGSLLMTEQQAAWVAATRKMIGLRPLKSSVSSSKYGWRRKLFDLVENNIYFDSGIMGAIMVNVLFLAMDSWRPEPGMAKAQEIANWVFTLLFCGEMVLKLVALGPRLYYKDPWNDFDCFLVVTSIIDLVLKNLPGDTKLPVPPVLIRVLRIFRVVRILRIVKTAKTLRQLLVTLYTSFPALGNVGSILFLAMFIYAILGMNMFYQVPFGDFVNRHCNFTGFIRAMDLLFRSATGESWNGLMHDCMAVNGIAIPYFLSYWVLSASVMLNLVIGVILENFGNQSMDSDLTMENIEEFRSVWNSFDPHGTYTISCWRLPQLLTRLQPPLGLLESGKAPPTRLLVLRRIKAVEVPNHGGLIHFHETLSCMANHIAGVNLPYCALTKSLNKSVEAMATLGVRDKLPEAPTSAAEYYAVSLVQSHWRGKQMRAESSNDEQIPTGTPAPAKQPSPPVKSRLSAARKSKSKSGAATNHTKASARSNKVQPVDHEPSDHEPSNGELPGAVQGGDS